MNGVLGDWQAFFPHPWAEIALVLASVLCGAAVGAERERKVKPAGLRTMMLICLGSTVFTLLSPELGGGPGERGRVAAQVVSGIGFLGAGAILRGADGVRGLTSAATIWAVAAIGMVIGAGLGAAGLGLTALLLGSLTGVTGLEDRYLGPCRFRRVELVYGPHAGKTAVKIAHLLDEYRVRADARHTAPGEDAEGRLVLTYCSAHKHHKGFLLRFAEMPEIRSIRDLGG